MIIIILFVQCIFAADKTNAIQERSCMRSKQSLKLVIERIIIDEIAKNHKCIVFIFDSYYKKIIESVWSQGQLVTLGYVISIRHNETFFPSEKRIQPILTNSKEAGCDAYVILMANDLEVVKLLQYAEENRLINTRGDFLMLYDDRLFIPEMHYIWNRILNVLFVRRYESVNCRSGEPLRNEWFDIVTVNYPMNLKNSVTKHVDTWYKGRFRYGVKLFDEKTKNLHGKSLKVAIFDHIPAVTKHALTYSRNKSNPDSKALGIEYELMKIAEKSINFKALVYVPPDVKTERWGSLRDNDSYTGLLGEAVSRNAVFFLGDLHYTTEHLHVLDLSVPYHTECLTFLTPEALNDNSWKLLVLPFKLYTWIAVLFTLFAGGFIIHFFAIYYKNHVMLHKNHTIDNAAKNGALKELVAPKKSISKKAKFNQESRGLRIFMEIQNSIMYTYSMLMLVSLPRLPDAWFLRIFIGWWWLYSILVSVAYRASMTATLANPVQRVTIDTLSQLANSPIAVGSWGEGRKQFFLSSLDPNTQKIGTKFEVTTIEDEAISRVANGTFAYYENIYVLREARAKRQALEVKRRKSASKLNRTFKQDRNLHIMQECVINMPIALGLDKNSPLKPNVDRLVQRAIEAGLVQKWLNDVMEWAKNSEKPLDTNAPKALINLHKLYGALVALGIGYSLGFITLVYEILHWKYIVLKDSKYDKYYLDVFYK
ncbi:Ionotropic receptor 68a [Cephus cinctus]|uniref:Ionotropic receptor 40a isoform X2 n=1 Tax=Cephus cinctus TaxID=211228 RepID=A0A3L9LSY2_CEPCN|nr:ionotropic receptor 40a isoform X2 [Cephus cinctus]RLZ02244.1 Ionotropic receptor 68a [Cephus cinctus]